MNLIYIGIINFVTQRDRKNFLHLNTFNTINITIVVMDH